VGTNKSKIASNDVILDVGCGGGKTLGRLARLAPFGKVFGVENSSDMVDYSKKVNEKLISRDRVQIVGGSVEKMCLPDNYFDLVKACEAYYFWLNFRDALKEIKRVLKPDGKPCLLNEMAKDGVYEIKNAKLIEKTHVHLSPLQETRNVMLSIGFADVQAFTKTESPWNTVLAQKIMCRVNSLPIFFQNLPSKISYLNCVKIIRRQFLQDTWYIYKQRLFQSSNCFVYLFWN